MLTALRVINIVVWSGLLLYMIPGAHHAVTGKDVRRGDPMRLGVGAVCLVMLLGNLRWLLVPDSDLLFAAIYVLSAIVGLYVARLAHAYGRGPKL